jgi:hypothetical protein
MLDRLKSQIEILELLVEEYKTDLNINKVLDKLEYLKFQVRTIEDETSEWCEFFGRLP